MNISASIASGDVLRLADEIEYADKYFDDIHLDVADGWAVDEITFGIKTCIEACHLAKKKCSIHLEVVHPLNYLDDIKSFNSGVVFIQINQLENPKKVIQEFQKSGIHTGININKDDLFRDDLSNILSLVDVILVGTTVNEDKYQICQDDMLDYAVQLANTEKYDVWIDGGITYDIFRKVYDSKINTIVMGRALFEDKEKAIQNFKKHFRKEVIKND